MFAWKSSLILAKSWFYYLGYVMAFPQIWKKKNLTLPLQVKFKYLSCTKCRIELMQAQLKDQK